MASTRVRQRNHGAVTGILTRSGPGYSNSENRSRDSGVSTCTDWVGNPFGDNELVIRRWTHSGGLLNGHQTLRGQDTWRYVNYPVWFGHVGRTDWWEGTRSDGDWAIVAASRTNPSRPDLLAPVALKELGDLPKMIRHAGRFLNKTTYKPKDGLSAAKEVASAHLAAQFGWIPIIRDLQYLARFTEAVDRRRKEIDRLHSGRGLKRRIRLHSFERTHNDTYFIANFFGRPLMVDRRTTVTNDSWATCVWKPESQSGLAPNNSEISRMLLGLTPSAIAENVWEALPWSWLIDWFTNVGDYVSMRNNHLGAQLISCCRMYHVKTMTVGSAVTLEPDPSDQYFSGSLTLSSARILNEEKIRRVALPSLSGISARLPLLTGSQLSILGALTVNRVR